MSRRRGMTLAECVAAVAMVGLALMTLNSFMGAGPRATERLQANQDLLAAVDGTLEAVRAGAIPLASAAIDNDLFATAPTTRDLNVRVAVSSAGPTGLHRVTATASCTVRHQPLERQLETLVWRPR